MTEADIAAWVQAFGSIGAIGVAIWLSRRDSVERSRDRKARARNAAIFLIPHFRDRLRQMEFAWHQKDIGHRPDYFGQDADDRGVLDYSRIPEGFMDVFRLAAMLDEAEAPVQYAFMQMCRFDTLCHSVAIEDDTGEGYYFPTDKHKLIWTALEMTIAATRKALLVLDAVIQAK